MTDRTPTPNPSVSPRRHSLGQTLLAAVRSAIYLVIQTIALVIIATATLVTAPVFSPNWRYKTALQFPRFMTWTARWVLGIRDKVVGAEHLASLAGTDQLIVCSKHQSSWETLYLASALPRVMCFVFKRELLVIPFFGWAIGLLHMASIDRRQGKQAFEQIADQAPKQFGLGRWFCFFPEGTRTLPGVRAPYKIGAAKLAVLLNAPILPVALNSGLLWPRNSLIRHAGEVTVVYGPLMRHQPHPPVTERNPEGDPAVDLMNRVEDWIEEQVRGIS